MTDWDRVSHVHGVKFTYQEGFLSFSPPPLLPLLPPLSVSLSELLL